MQANLPSKFWHKAERHFSTARTMFTQSLSDPTKSKFEEFTGQTFEGFAPPFGALTHYKPKPETLGSHEPLTKPALFLGWDLGPGLRWTQIYRFLDYESLQKGVFQEVTSREIVLPDGPWKFPLAEARDEAMAVFDKLDFPTLCSGLPEEASVPSKSLPSAEPDAVDSDKQHPSPSEAAIQDGDPVEAAP
ncbi:MAG: hypothetical protein GY768_05010, partial [Planctomycetaceae bacterium]|nr:hypothetical protein [Planctomycetaceae bacterium]